MVIKIKLSTLLIGILTIPIFPVWLCMSDFGKDSDSVFAIGVLFAILAFLSYLFAVIPITDVKSAGNPIEMEHGVKQEVVLQHHSLLPIMPYSWDYEEAYVRITRKNGENVWINKRTNETCYDDRWDENLASYNGNHMDAAIVHEVLNDSSK